MELHKDNPYANGRIIVFDDNTAELERDTVVLPPNIAYRLHQVKENEYLDDICDQYYGAKTNYPEWYSYLIADINDIDCPLDQSSYEASVLVIPDFDSLDLI
jgi:hypothetical protein